MSWQIQCKQHFLKQLYALNNQLESEETLTWHEDVQMYCWDCMRVRGGVREGDYNEYWAWMRLKRGAMFCCVWEFMRVVWGSVREVWELLREVMWYESCSERLCESCMRVIERGDGQIIIGISRDSGQRRPDKLDKTWLGQTDGKWPSQSDHLQNRVSKTWFPF